MGMKAFTWLCVGAVVTELTKIKNINVCNWLGLTCVKYKQTLFYISSFTKCLLYIFSNAQCKAGKADIISTFPMRKLKIRFTCPSSHD